MVQRIQMPRGVFKKSEEHIAKLRAHLIQHNKRLGELKRGKKRPEISGPKHRDWRGGRFVTKRGYVLVWKPDHPNCNKNGYVFEHRLVMEKRLGRYLVRGEIVHHENGIKDDNRDENLRLMFNAQHVSMEQTEDMSGRTCSECGSNETRRRDWHYKDDSLICDKCYDREYQKIRRRRKKLGKVSTIG